MQGHVDSERLTMPIRRSKDGRWRYRHVVYYPDGTRERINGSAPTHINTKAAAEQAMLDHIERSLHPERVPSRKEQLTFAEWFNGRFWKEWVTGRKNKPGEQREKTVIFDCYLEPRFGKMALDEITTSEVAKFRADLITRETPRVIAKPGKEDVKKLSDKRINNVLAVLSKAMKYAVDCDLIVKAPKIGMFKVERPEIVAWDFEQYARLLAAAKVEGDEWYAAICLAGEAGLRVGEVKALRWREDVDLIARTITVNQQTSRGETGTPKGRTRRTVPMTATVHEALKRMEVIRDGLVIRNLDGTAKSDRQAVRAIERICRRAGLPVRLFHTLRHTFGTRRVRSCATASLARLEAAAAPTSSTVARSSYAAGTSGHVARARAAWVMTRPSSSCASPRSTSSWASATSLHWVCSVSRASRLPSRRPSASRRRFLGAALLAMRVRLHRRSDHAGRHSEHSGELSGAGRALWLRRHRNARCRQFLDDGLRQPSFHLEVQHPR